MLTSRWPIVVCFAGLLASALGCTSNSRHESTDSVASCRLDDRDTEVLQTVLDEVVLGSGACAEPGLVLVYERTVSPDFPATLEERRWQQEIDARLVAGEEVEEEELVAPTHTSVATDLVLHNGMTLDRATVQSTLDREGCGIGELESPAGWSLVDLETGAHRDLFAQDIPEGWTRLRKRFAGMQCLVRFSAPGYPEDSSRAVVSYSRMSGPLGGMGGFVVLEREGDRWRIEWAESLWVS